MSTGKSSGEIIPHENPVKTSNSNASNGSNRQQEKRPSILKSKLSEKSIAESKSNSLIISSRVSLEPTARKQSRGNSTGSGSDKDSKHQSLTSNTSGSLQSIMSKYSNHSVNSNLSGIKEMDAWADQNNDSEFNSHGIPAVMNGLMKSNSQKIEYGPQVKPAAKAVTIHEDLGSIEESNRSINLQPPSSTMSQLDEKQEQSTNFDSTFGSRFSSVYSLGSTDYDVDQEEEEDELLYKFEGDYGFEKIKQVYQKILEEFQQHEKDQVCLEPIRSEFISLWEGIVASHNNEKELIRKDQEISVALSTTMAKTRNLMKLAEDDMPLAWRLGQQLEKAWNKVDEGDENESANQAKLDQLRQDIFDLNRNINAASHVEGQDIVKELQKMKNELEKRRDGANIEVNKYRSSLNILFAKRQEVFERRSNLEEKSNLLDEEYVAQNEAIEREMERKKRIASEMQEVEAKLEKKQSELNKMENTLQHSANKIIDVERSVVEQSLVNEGTMRDQDLSVNRLEKLRNDFDQQQKVVDRLTMAAYKQVQDLKTQEGEVTFLKMEFSRALRQRSFNTKRVILLQQTMTTLEIERESLKGKINILEKELEEAQKKLDDHKRKVEKLDKERSFVNQNLKRADAVTSEHATQVITHKVAVQNLTDAVVLFNEEIGDQKATIAKLENERDFYSLESTKMAQQLAFQLTELKKLDLAVLKYKKKLALIDTQLKKTQQTYDLAVYDKGVFAQSLTSILADIFQNHTKIKLLTNQVASLKYQVNQKDEIIHQEALRYDRILKETEYYSKESKRIKRMAEDIQRHTEALEVERSTLGCAIEELGGELRRENYHANAAESRIDVFHRKLMNQDIQLRVTWEKWRTLDSQIRTGAYHYRKLMRDICSVRFSILSNRKSQNRKMKIRANHGTLQREVTVLENCVAHEKCMMNALTEQKKIPLNVHRWRLLEATNPTAYEMILKINLLTKRLVDRNNHLKEQTRQLMEKENIYVEMIKGLARSPGLETPEEVAYNQHLLVVKRQQYNNLKYELKAAEVQTKYYRELVIQLNEKMQNLKKKYFDTLKGNRKASSCRVVQNSSKRLKLNDHQVVHENYDFITATDG